MVDSSKALADLGKQFQAGAVFLPTMQVDFIKDPVSTGVVNLDAALGIGGWARAKQHVVYGAFSTGKTALVLTAIGKLHKQDGKALVCIVDYEGSVTPEWMVLFGIDLERCVVMAPSSVEEGSNMLNAAIRQGVFDLIVFDSLGAVSKSVETGDKADANSKQYGGAALDITRMANRVTSELTLLCNEHRAHNGDKEALKKVKAKKDKEKLQDKIKNANLPVLPAIVYIGQARINMDSKFNDIKLTGGEGLKHALCTSIKMRVSGKPEDILKIKRRGEEQIAVRRVIAQVNKNKLAPAWREATYWFCNVQCPEYEFGVDSAGALVAWASLYGVIEKSGAWYSFGEPDTEGYVKRQGEAAMCQVIRDNPEFYEVVRKKTMDVVAQEALEEKKLANDKGIDTDGKIDCD